MGVAALEHMTAPELIVSNTVTARFDDDASAILALEGLVGAHVPFEHIQVAVGARPPLRVRFRSRLSRMVVGGLLGALIDAIIGVRFGVRRPADESWKSEDGVDMEARGARGRKRSLLVTVDDAERTRAARTVFHRAGARRIWMV